MTKQDLENIVNYIVDQGLKAIKEYMREKLSKFEIIKIRKTSSIYHSYKSSFIEAVAKK